MRQLLSDLWSGEPTLVLALLRAATVAGLMLFTDLPEAETVAVYGIVEALSAFYNRSKVSPV